MHCKLQQEPTDPHKGLLTWLFYPPPPPLLLTQQLTSHSQLFTPSIRVASRQIWGGGGWIRMEGREGRSIGYVIFVFYNCNLWQVLGRYNKKIHCQPSQRFLSSSNAEGAWIDRRGNRGCIVVRQTRIIKKNGLTK